MVQIWSFFLYFEGLNSFEFLKFWIIFKLDGWVRNLFHSTGNRKTRARIPAQSNVSLFPQEDFKFIKFRIILFFNVEINLSLYWYGFEFRFGLNNCLCSLFYFHCYYYNKIDFRYQRDMKKRAKKVRLVQKTHYI